MRCNLAIRLIVVSIFLVACTDATHTRPNILIISIDTTRADHIGVYGKGEGVTPHIDALADHGVLFEQARSVAPITLPAHTSMLTGTYPMYHGIRDNGLFVLADDGNTTLAEILSEQGYATGAAVGAFPMTRQFGLAQGFDYYNDAVSQPTLQNSTGRGRGIFFDERPAEAVNAAILPWIADNRDQPFFAFVHYFDPHHPHVAPPVYREAFPGDGYLAEIAYADAAIGQLLDQLDSWGELANTIVVVTADHGEGLGSHAETTHSLLNYDTTLHVPLIVSWPSNLEQKRVSRLVGSVDIVPTVLDLALVDIPEPVQGQSLVPLMTQSSPDWLASPEYYAETLSPRVSHGWGELRTLFWQDYKYIHGPRSELYAWTKDKEELTNLMEQDNAVADRMRNRLETFIQSHAANRTSQVSAASDTVIQKLQALGYVQGSGDTSTIVEELREDGIPPQDRVHQVNALSMAKSALSKGNPVTAMTFIEALLEEDPKNSHYHLLAAQAAVGLSNFDQAEHHIRQSIAIQSLAATDFAAIRLYVKILSALERYDDWLDIVQDHQQINQSAEGQLYLARSYLEQHQPLKSIRHFERAQQLGEKSVDLYRYYGAALAQSNQKNAAEQVFKVGLANHPYDATLKFNYAVFLYEQQQLKQALKLMKQVLHWRPEYLAARNALAILAMELDLSELAAQQLDWFARRLPDHQTAVRLNAYLQAQDTPF